MGRAYVQLTLEDRCEIARRRADGQSIRQIAAALDRQPSSIAREIKRNSGRKVGYQPTYAQEQTRARRWKGSKLTRNPELQKAVLDRLAQGWSPEQVAGRLSREAASERVSYETIYRFIYAQIRRTNCSKWRLYLPRAKSRRGYRGVRGGSPASFIQARVPLQNRGSEASHRQVPGHWEADLVLFAKYGQAVLALHERASRILLAARPQNRTADLVAAIMMTLLDPLPEAMRQSVTFDNGTEFARHYRLHDLGFKTFFCDPHAPWQKGGIENAIGRLRRTLPRKTDLATIPNERFARLLRAYNSTPRKCLDFQTPAEIFLAQVLHFECESTSRPSSG
jgi:IS30 family transposase